MWDQTLRVWLRSRAAATFYTDAVEVKNSSYIVMRSTASGGGFQNSVAGRRRDARARTPRSSRSAKGAGALCKASVAGRRSPRRCRDHAHQRSHEIVGSLIEAFCSGRADEVFSATTEFCLSAAAGGEVHPASAGQLRAAENAGKGGAHVLTEYDLLAGGVFHRSDPRVVPACCTAR